VNVIIVDDEFLARERLELLLNESSIQVVIQSKASNGLEAIEQINSKKPDLVFLDIQMPEINGFQVIEKLTHLPLIVFTTAFDEYALDAFRAHAIRYLLKPIKQHELNEALAFAQKHLNLTHSSTQTAEKLLVKEAGKSIYLPIKEIRILLTINRVIFIYTEHQKYIADRGMDEYEQLLTNHGFFRGHRSYLIHLSHVESFKRDSSGKLLVKMNNKIEATVSRDHTKAFQEALNKHINL